MREEGGDEICKGIDIDDRVGGLDDDKGHVFLS